MKKHLPKNPIFQRKLYRKLFFCKFHLKSEHSSPYSHTNDEFHAYVSHTYGHKCEYEHTHLKIYNEKITCCSVYTQQAFSLSQVCTGLSLDRNKDFSLARPNSHVWN